MPATAISLVREHSLKMRPPRALWVPFELGRPFGAPGAAAFQARVVRAALDLLVRKDGPVVHADFPDDAPGPKAEDMTGWVCPVNLKPPPSDDGERALAFVEEVASLAPWYEISVEKRGRTTVGLSGLPMVDAARLLAGFLDDTPPEGPSGQPVAVALKNATADVMAYYLEAATAQPGRRSSGEALDWFWNQTTAGRLFRDLREALAEHENPAVQRVATRLLVPKVAGG